MISLHHDQFSDPSPIPFKCCHCDQEILLLCIRLCHPNYTSRTAPKFSRNQEDFAVRFAKDGSQLEHSLTVWLSCNAASLAQEENPAKEDIRHDQSHRGGCPQ